MLKPHAKLEVDVAQESGLEAVENDLVPDDAGGKKSALAVGGPAVVDLYRRR